MLLTTNALRRAALGLMALCGMLDSVGAQMPLIDLRGKPDATPAEPLTDATNLVVLRNGLALFVDRSEERLVLADFTRDTAWRIGRTGSGPGEYRSPDNVLLTRDGGALVSDLAQARAVVVSPTGAITGTTPSTVDVNGTRISLAEGIDPSGRALTAVKSPVGGSDSLEIIRYDARTSTRTHMAWWPMVRTTLGPVVQTPRGSAQVMHQSMWPMRPAWAVLPDGSVVVVRPEPYHLEITTPDGIIHRGPITPYRHIKVDETEKSAVRSDRGPVPDSDFPSEKPPFLGIEDVFVSPQSEIWVEHLRAANDSMPVYDVFDHTGHRVALARIEPNSRALGFGPSSIYVARQTPDDGFWHLERYDRKNLQP